MTLLSVADLKTHIPVVPQGVADAALQRLLDDAEDAITARRGPVSGPITEQHLGRVRLISLLRPASAITSIVESWASTSTPLADDDWQLHSNLMTLFRLGYGTHPADRWGDQVTITFTPRDDTAERKRVQVALVKLDLAYTGWANVSTQSEVRSALPNYLQARTDILASFPQTGLRRF